MKYRKIISGALAVCMVCSMFVFQSGPSALHADAATNNILTNPGLEQGTAGWTFSGGGTESTSVYAGSNSGYVSSGRGNQASQTVTVPVTGDYNLSGWFVGQPGAGLSIEKDGKPLSQARFNSDSGYTQYIVSDVSLSKGDKVNVVVSSGFGGTVYFDNLSLTRDDADMVELALNPDFESGSSDWTLTSGASVAADGSNHLLSLASGSAEQASQVITVPLTGSYKLSAKACGIDGTATLGVKNANGDVIAEKEIPQGTDVQTVTLSDISLTANSDATVYIKGSNGAEADNVSFQFDLSKVAPSAPSASSASISGDVFSGNILTGTYAFSDSKNYPEGKSAYRWLISDTSSGTYSPISGATSLTYTPTAAQAGKYIKFEVTPADLYAFKGAAVSSSASQVVLNLTTNYGFESGASSWSFTSGAGVLTSAQSPSSLSPKSGSEQAYAGASSRIAQVVTVPVSGYYTFSAYAAVLNGTTGGTIGIRRTDGESILNMKVLVSSSYNHLLADNIPLEKGDQIEIYLNGGNGTTYVDNFEVKLDNNKSAPAFGNISSFTVQNQIGSSSINKNTHTVSFTMPYGMDVSTLTPTIGVSEGASISPNNAARDFSDPVTYYVKASSGHVQAWTVTCTTEAKGITISSSNAEIKEAFRWAINKALGTVQTGKTGLLNVDERSTATSVGTFIPSYWSGYSYRSAFYIRDYAHQASGAHLLGLDKENLSMLKAFVSTASASSKWYPAWALNFDGSIFKLDHSSDTTFVREVPAVFELVEQAYNQYLWTGNKAYITNSTLLNYYKEVLTDFISLHDTQKVNGVAEGVGSTFDLYLGMASYNEQGNEQIIESGDGIACEYAAMAAYAKLLKASGDTAGAATYAQKASALKAYFNSTWGVAADGSAQYVRAYSATGKQYTDFGKEESWFMLMKGITDPGAKTDAYLDYVQSQLGTSAGLPTNMEACTYLPDTFFRYGENERAWKWMKYIIENRNTQHVNSAEGVDGNYPEISYTLVNQTVSGLMGITPNAPSNEVVTLSHLPSGISWLALNDVKVGSHDISVKNIGAKYTKLTHNKGGKVLHWQAQFRGTYASIKVNGKLKQAKHTTVNGIAVSYVNLVVPVGKTVTAQVSNATVK